MATGPGFNNFPTNTVPTSRTTLNVLSVSSNWTTPGVILSTTSGSTAGQIVTSSLTSPQTTETVPVVDQCPDLTSQAGNSKDPKASDTNAQFVKLSTRERNVWTVVTAQCVGNSNSKDVVYLQCLDTGQWNSTLPFCSVERLDVSSFKLYFAVAGGVSGLAVLVLLILFCYVLRIKRNKSSSSSSGDSNQDIYVDPCHISDSLATSYKQRQDDHDVIYSKPGVYSTFTNPTFQEDAYERWRQQELILAERVYESPWTKPRGLKSQMETSGFKWSQKSLDTLTDTRMPKLPRVVLSLDQHSITSTDTAGPLGSTRGPLLRQSSQDSQIPEAASSLFRLGRGMSRSDTCLDTSVTGVQDEIDTSHIRTSSFRAGDAVTNF